MASDANKKKVVKKKISPYPFPGEMNHGASKVVVAVLRVGVRGMIAAVRSGICHVGVHYQCQFTLPTSPFACHVEGQVFKTHDGMNVRGGVNRTVEVLFKRLPDEERVKINAFLKAIEQKE